MYERADSELPVCPVARGQPRYTAPEVVITSRIIAFPVPCILPTRERKKSGEELLIENARGVSPHVRYHAKSLRCEKKRGEGGREKKKRVLIN